MESDEEKYAMKKWILFIVAILTLCSSVARADDPNDSNKKAIEIYRTLAARYMLTKIYLNSGGVTQDYKEAVNGYDREASTLLAQNRVSKNQFESPRMRV